jgi:dienelactone hydrolase
MNSLDRSLRVFLCLVFGWLAGCTAALSAPVSVGYTEQKLMLDNGSYKVPGVLVTPTTHAKQKLPVIVMLHGTASQKNEVGGLYQRLAVYLAGRGYASLRIDFAGTGDSPVDYRFYNLSSARHDATTALNYLSARSEFDSQRMGLVGFSQGGLIAQLVAAHDTRIKAMVTWSSTAGDGAGIYQAFVFDEFYAEAQRNGFAQVNYPWLDRPLNFGLQWFEEVRDNTSLTDMANYHGKLLAIAGTADTLVPYAASLQLVAAAGSEHASFYLVKGADHMYNVLADGNALAADQANAEELLAITTEWLARQL